MGLAISGLAGPAVVFLSYGRVAGIAGLLGRLYPPATADWPGRRKAGAGRAVYPGRGYPPPLGGTICRRPVTRHQPAGYRPGYTLLLVTVNVCVVLDRAAVTANLHNQLQPQLLLPLLIQRAKQNPGPERQDPCKEANRSRCYPAGAATGAP